MWINRGIRDRRRKQLNWNKIERAQFIPNGLYPWGENWTKLKSTHLAVNITWHTLSATGRKFITRIYKNTRQRLHRKMTYSFMKNTVTTENTTKLSYLSLQALLNNKTAEFKIKKLVKLIKLAHEIINGKYIWGKFSFYDASLWSKEIFSSNQYAFINYVRVLGGRGVWKISTWPYMRGGWGVKKQSYFSRVKFASEEKNWETWLVNPFTPENWWPPLAWLIQDPSSYSVAMFITVTQIIHIFQRLKFCTILMEKKKVENFLVWKSYLRGGVFSKSYASLQGERVKLAQIILT